MSHHFSQTRHSIVLVNPLKRIMADARGRRQPLDLHLHTRFSIDVSKGSSFDEYMEAGDRLGIVPGFLDHFQSEKLGTHRYPFNEDMVPAYLEAYDKAKRSGLKSYLGLEVDYYDPALHDDWNQKMIEWLDAHAKDFDYFVGTVHDVLTGTITIPFELEVLLKGHGFPAIEDAYFRVLDAGIRSESFDGFAHLDVIYRFCGKSGVVKGDDRFYLEPRTLSAMELCANTGTVIELNLRGFDHPWNSTYPSEAAFMKFRENHVKDAFFPGSDSHDVKTFERFAPITRKYSDLLYS
nr:PHP domain-containing protein [Candidatus Sigynarchaeum springense]